jgi:hypothetical protein
MKKTCYKSYKRPIIATKSIIDAGVPTFKKSNSRMECDMNSRCYRWKRLLFVFLILGLAMCNSEAMAMDEGKSPGKGFISLMVVFIIAGTIHKRWVMRRSSTITLTL